MSAASQPAAGGPARPDDDVVREGVVPADPSGGADFAELLMSDHRRAEALWDAYQTTRSPEVLERLCQELSAHSDIEEEFVYPLLATIPGREKTATRATNQHESVANRIATIQLDGYGTPGVETIASSMMADVSFHVREEEGEILPVLRDHVSAARLRVLAGQIAAARRLRPGPGPGPGPS